VETSILSIPYQRNYHVVTLSNVTNRVNVENPYYLIHLSQKVMYGTMRAEEMWW